MEILLLGTTLLGGVSIFGVSYLLGNKPPTIEPGVLRVLDLEDCEEAGNCFYQNGFSFYGRNILVDYSTQLITPDPGLTQLDTFFGAFLLNPNQAMVMIGPLPVSRYWNFIPYWWRKIGTDEVLFASVTQGFNIFSFPGIKNIAVIMTRNQHVYERERTRILTERPEGLTVVPLWVPSEVPLDVSVSYLFRANFFPENTPAEQIQNPGFLTYRASYDGIPFAGIQVYYTEEQRLKIPAGVLQLKQTINPTEVSEEYLRPQFDAYVEEVISDYDIVRELEILPFLQREYGINYFSGYQCIDLRIPCFGDNPDSFYSTSESFRLNSGESILLISLNHIETGRANFVSNDVYQESVKLGIRAIEAPPGQLFYSELISDLVPDEYRVASRSYIQLPENIAPDGRTMIEMRLFIVSISSEDGNNRNGGRRKYRGKKIKYCSSKSTGRKAAGTSISSSWLK